MINNNDLELIGVSVPELDRVLEYGPGFSRASLEALEGALVGGTRRLSAGPPVIIAHSIMVRSQAGDIPRQWCSCSAWSMWGTGILTMIMGLTWQGFVAQKFLESHAARGLVLLNSFPPSPGMCHRGLMHLFATAIQR